MKQSLIYQLIVEKSTATSKQLILAIPSKFHTKSSCFKLDWLNEIVLNEKNNLDKKKQLKVALKVQLQLIPTLNLTNLECKSSCNVDEDIFTLREKKKLTKIEAKNIWIRVANLIECFWLQVAVQGASIQTPTSPDLHSF